jgi:hypothetical protein
MFAISRASIYFAILLWSRHFTISNSFRNILSTSFTSSPTPFNRSPEDIIQSIKQAENVCRERHDNRAILALFLPAPERPIPQPCGPSAQDNSFPETSPTYLYGLKCKSIPPKDFPAGSYLRLGPGGYSKCDGILDGDGIVLCEHLVMSFTYSSPSFVT